MMLLHRVAAATAIAILLLCASAFAHDPYTGYRNPVTDYGCCNGTDCAAVSASDIERTAQGWLYVPTGETLPFNQALPSFDHRHHVCRPYGVLRCILVPGLGTS